MDKRQNKKGSLSDVASYPKSRSTLGTNKAISEYQNDPVAVLTSLSVPIIKLKRSPSKMKMLIRCF